jgi:hypothetical protein
MQTGITAPEGTPVISPLYITFTKTGLTTLEGAPVTTYLFMYVFIKHD